MARPQIQTIEMTLSNGEIIGATVPAFVREGDPPLRIVNVRVFAPVDLPEGYEIGDLDKQAVEPNDAKAI